MKFFKIKLLFVHVLNFKQVADRTLPISRDELNMLRQIRSHEGDHITYNNRPVQAMNGRTVNRFFVPIL